jgi:protease I
MNQLRDYSMKKSTLAGKKIAVLLADGFEEEEMTKPREALLKAGADIFLITPKGKKVRSWQHDKWGKYFKVNKNIKHVNPKDFDGLLLPGGVMNPDKLRTDQDIIKFITYFMKNKKPTAAICHGPWTLIETKTVKGMTLTSYHSIKTDLINAGAKWVNKKVVKDKNLVTSRSPKDLPAFNKEMVKLFIK